MFFFRSRRFVMTTATAAVAAAVAISTSTRMKASCETLMVEGGSEEKYRAVLEALRPSPMEYERVVPSSTTTGQVALELFHVKGNALHDTLNGAEMIEHYEVFRRKGHDEILCLIKVGTQLNGYPGITHGGITALLFDNTYGWVFVALGAPWAVTANLNVNYRRPIMAGSWIHLKARLEKMEGRKLYMTAEMTDLQGHILADSSTLFVVKKKDHQLSTAE